MPVSEDSCENRRRDIYVKLDKKCEKIFPRSILIWVLGIIIAGLAGLAGLYVGQNNGIHEIKINQARMEVRLQNVENCQQEIKTIVEDIRDNGR